MVAGVKGWARVLMYLAGLVAMLGPVPGRAEKAVEGYSFAVVPQLEQRRLAALWAPVVEAVAVRAGIGLTLIANLNVRAFERALDAGTYDFVFANPYQILRERTRQGYLPLVGDQTPLRGLLVVRRDSRVVGPAGLEGAVMAVPSPNAVAASLLMRADLERQFGVHVKLLDVKTHDAVFLAVASGAAEAGGGVEKVFAALDPLLRGALRVIYTTREMPAHAVAAHPRVPEAVREQVRRALLDLATTPEGRALLTRVAIERPGAARPSDYDSLSDWALDRFWLEEKTEGR